MRVCLICNQIAAWGKIGGFGSMARMIGRNLVQRGVEVCVVCRRRGGQRREETLDGMRVIGLNAWQTLTSKSVFADVNADVFHSQEPTIGTWLAQRAMPRARHVVTCIDPRDKGDWRVEFKHSTLKRKLVYPIQRYYEDGRRVQAAVRAADGVFCQARFIIPKVVEMYKLRRPPQFLPNPIDVPDHLPRKAQRPTCAFVGRFDRRKRPELFFECVRENPGVQFVAVGRAHDQGYDDRLRRAFGHLRNLELTGYIDPFETNKLQELYARSWVLVNTAAREGLPATFLEACAQGCALLAMVDPDGMTTRFGMRAEEGRFGDALKHLLDNRRWEPLGAAGYDYVRDTYSVRRAVDLHLRVYEEVLATRRDPQRNPPL